MTQPPHDENPAPADYSDAVAADADGAAATEQSPAPVQTHTPAPAKSSGGLPAGIWAALIIGALVLVLLLVFIIQNNEPTQFHYFGWEFTLPLGVSILLAAIAGIIIAAIFGSVRIYALSRQVKRERKRR